MSAIPGLRKVPSWIPKFVFISRIRAIILFVDFLVMAVPPLVLLPLSDTLFLQGNLSVSRQLYQAGMAYLAILQTIFAGVFAIFFTIFRIAATRRLRNAQDRANSMLVMTVTKVNTNTHTSTPTRTYTNIHNNPPNTIKT